jgi:hypothetical protein
MGERGPASSNASAMRSVNKTAVQKGAGRPTTGSSRPATRGRDHTHADADRGRPTWYCPRGDWHEQCPSIPSVAFPKLACLRTPIGRALTVPTAPTATARNARRTRRIECFLPDGTFSALKRLIWRPSGQEPPPQLSQHVWDKASKLRILNLTHASGGNDGHREARLAPKERNVIHANNGPIGTARRPRDGTNSGTV